MSPASCAMIFAMNAHLSRPRGHHKPGIVIASVRTALHSLNFSVHSARTPIISPDLRDIKQRGQNLLTTVATWVASHRCPTESCPEIWLIAHELRRQHSKSLC